MRIRALAVLLFVVWVPLSAGDLDSERQRKVIDGINRLLAENYVYPETAARMAEHLGRQFESGAYSGIVEGPAFAEKLTADLQSVSKDKHLRVSHAPDRARRLLNAVEGEPDPAQRALMLEESRRGNFGFRRVEILPGNLGYLEFTGFSGLEEAGETAVAAMNFLAHTDALIIDLRGNGGGSPRMIQILSSYLFDGEPQHLNSFYWRPKDETTQTWTLPYVPGKRQPEVPVFVLTSGRTFSAAEEFTYNLKNMKRATVVGETSGGGAHPGGTKAVDEEFMVWLPQGRAINPVTGTNWEGTGVTPDIECPAGEALERAQLAALDMLEAKADNPRQKAQLRWAREDLEARLHPVELSEALMREYEGQYGPRRITFREGGLYYQRDDGPWHRMVAMKEDLFGFEEIPFFRIEVVRREGKAVAVIGHYDNGQTDRHEKEP